MVIVHGHTCLRAVLRSRVLRLTFLSRRTLLIKALLRCNFTFFLSDEMSKVIAEFGLVAAAAASCSCV